MGRRVVIVEDDRAERRLLAARLIAEGWKVAEAADGPSALRLLGEGGTADIVLLDIGLPGMDGFEVLAALRRRGLPVRVVMVTADASVTSVVRSIRGGAEDYLVKPVPPAELSRVLEDLSCPSDEAAEAEAFAGLVAAAPPMRAAVATARRAASARIPLLLLGESGTGKERFARAIHRASARAAGPFVAVNCGALPEALVESLLFGHEKGAFSGAAGRHEGRFREADGGTIFLDEVGELPLASQVKLLRVLQEGEVDPVGARLPVRVDVRVISATNRDLRAEVATGRFREDLFFRLAGIAIELPPLRDRREDIPALALAQAEAIARLEGRPFEGFGPGVTDWLMAQDWPGNVRELLNLVHRAMVLSEPPFLTLEAFAGQAIPPPAPRPVPPAAAEPARVRPLAALEAEAIAD
ncbi:MAG TPA: sigma-54 dependent transcriptional regulator, partial [Paracoccaceae bacterium]|nr:sigma-54 dependent transcriptional regulator [Paracoccaceae bacterium]